MLFYAWFVVSLYFLTSARSTDKCDYSLTVVERVMIQPTLYCCVGVLSFYSLKYNLI